MKTKEVSEKRGFVNGDKTYNVFQGPDKIQSSSLNVQKS